MDLENWYRNRFSNKLLEILAELQKAGELPEDLFDAKNVLTIGGAFCNDVKGMCERYCPTAHICSIDPLFPPYKDFNIEYRRGKIQDFGPDDFTAPIDFIEMGHVLQEYSTDASKLKVLDAARRILKEGKYMILTEEKKRLGWQGFYDRFMHYAYNNTGAWDLFNHMLDPKLSDGYYIESSIIEYEELFETAGFEVVASKLYFRGTFVSILRAI